MINNKHKFILTICLLLAATMLFVLSTKEKKPTEIVSADEIVKIKNTTSLIDQAKLYTHLIERVGPVQAQDDLLRSGLPFTGQTHLLNHTVGDYLYKKFGAEGLSQCREYFLASCYHGFVLNAIGSGGIPEVAKVMQSCKLDRAVYPQCAHAVGHGFLTYVGYKNLTDALKECDQMPESVPDFPLFNCYDGIFMENIWAVHEDGKPSPDRWVKESDPFYPCNDKRIAQKYLLGCWSNQPALMYQLFHTDIKKVSEHCAKVPAADLKEMCYNGLSRQIHPITQGNLDKTFELCGLLGEKTNYCINTIAQSAFGVGDRTLPFQICNRIDAQAKESCYSAIIYSARAYSKSSSELAGWCAKIEDETWKQRCKN